MNSELDDVIKERDKYYELYMEYRTTLAWMVLQACSDVKHEKVHHEYLGAYEDAFDLLELEDEDDADKVYEIADSAEKQLREWRDKRFAHKV